jgi:DNA-binding SARP family transcriptional activator
VEFRILGRLEVVDDGRVVPFERQRARAVLAFLLLHANEPVSADRLIDEVWGPEPPKSAAASLQNYVSHLRKALGRDVLVTEAGGYVLRVDPERFDLARFERLVADAQHGEPRERAQKLRAALALWRGAPLEDLAFESFAQPAIRRLEEARLEAIEARIEAELALGSDDMVGELEELVERHPLREQFRAQLMRALYVAGRQADALAAYRDARRMLQDELGLEPGEELRALERKILDQDPSLRGATEDERPAPIESRRTVSVLFCDIVTSTELATRLDPEAYRRVIGAYFDAARTAIERHGGLVEKFIGDAVMALFGVPELHEDDALRAVRAAVDVRAAVARVSEEVASDWDARLAVRIAINTGEVVASAPGADTLVTGAPLNIAAHLEKRAGAGEIVLGETTQRLVRDAIRAEPIELGDGLAAWRLDALIAEAPAVARRLDAPLVGRQKELRRLRAAFQRARKDGSCAVVTVAGEAGIGKTRLARGLLDSLQDEARILVGRCVSYGSGATYLPLAEIVRQAAPEPTVAGIASLLAGEDDAEQVAERVGQLVGVTEGPAAPGEAFWAVRRFVEALAHEQPLVLVLDDVHWAEPTLLDLVEYLGEWADAPILVLCLARRDLLEARPAWGGPTSTGFVLELEPLQAEHVGALVEELAGGPVAPDIQEQIVEHAGGNPLFAEQLLALASEAPDVSLDQAPPTVEALIASRLDRLNPRELAVLRRAAVVGRRFTRAELDDLTPAEDASASTRHLNALAERGLVHPLEELYRFHHVLVRDVAYRGIPKAERAELHELAANGLDRREGADELVGYHFEQAYRYRIELARADEHADELAAAGGERLGRAGVRAWKRADAPAAVNLLGRAVELLPRDRELARELACELGLALRMHGELERAEEILRETAKASQVDGDRRLELRAGIELGVIHTLRDPDGAASELLELASTAISTFETVGDDRSAGRAWLSVGLIRGNFRGENAGLEEAAAKAAVHYRRAGWSPSSCLNSLGVALYYGPSPVGQAIAQCEDLLRSHEGDPASEANVLVWLGGLEGMRGRFDEGLLLVERAQTLYEQLGQLLAAGETCGFIRGAIELSNDRLESAEAALRTSCETCMQLNEPALLASRAAELADVLYAEGRYAETSTWVETSREHAGREDLDAESSWRSVEAKLRAREGAFADAEELAREAVEIAASTDKLNHRAKTLLDLAEVLRLADRDGDAHDLVRDSVRLYELKGNTAAAHAARMLLSASPVA